MKILKLPYTIPLIASSVLFLFGHPTAILLIPMSVTITLGSEDAPEESIWFNDMILTGIALLFIFCSFSSLKSHPDSSTALTMAAAEVFCGMLWGKAIHTRRLCEKIQELSKTNRILVGKTASHTSKPCLN